MWFSVGIIGRTVLNVTLYFINRLIYPSVFLSIEMKPFALHFYVLSSFFESTFPVSYGFWKWTIYVLEFPLAVWYSILKCSLSCPVPLKISDLSIFASTCSLLLQYLPLNTGVKSDSKKIIAEFLLCIDEHETINTFKVD